MHGMCQQRRHNLIVILVAEEVGGRRHLLLLLLGLLLRSSIGSTAGVCESRKKTCKKKIQGNDTAP